MSNQGKTSWTQELQDHWGWDPDGICPCGCGEAPSKGIFRPGHDQRVALNLLTTLLVELRGNQQVAQVIQDVAGAQSGWASKYVVDAVTAYSMVDDGFLRTREDSGACGLDVPPAETT